MPALATFTRVLLEDRAHKVLHHPMKRIPHAGFDGASAGEAALWLAPMPGVAEYRAKKDRLRPPPSAPPQLADHYRWPLLSKDQEQHLFRQMNFLKHLAAAALDRLRDGDLDALEEAEDSLARAEAVRERLWSANRRLVVKIAYKFATRLGRDFYDVLADGDVSLLNAVEMFDFSYGYKFSTYAYWAIHRNYAKSIPDPKSLKASTVSLDDKSEVLAAEEGDALLKKEHDLNSADTIRLLMTYLEPWERSLLRMRLGIGGQHEPKTLQDVGQSFGGVTKERARQMERAVISKLQDVAHTLQLDYEFA